MEADCGGHDIGGGGAGGQPKSMYEQVCATVVNRRQSAGVMSMVAFRGVPEPHCSSCPRGANPGRSRSGLSKAVIERLGPGPQTLMPKNDVSFGFPEIVRFSGGHTTFDKNDRSVALVSAILILALA